MALLCVTVLQGVGGESLVAGRKSLVANDYRDGRQLRKVDARCSMPSRLKDFDRFMMVMGCVQLWFCWKVRSRWEMEIATDVWSGWAHGRSAPVIPHSDVWGVAWASLVDILSICRKSVLPRDTRCSLLFIPNPSYQRFCTMICFAGGWREDQI